MLNTQVAKDYFQGTVSDNKAFIELIYKNSLGKTSAQDKEGVDYWTDLLNKGVSRGEIVKSIVQAAKAPENVAKDPVAAATFANKVEISEYLSSKIKNVLKDNKGNFDFSKFKEILESTNDKNLEAQKKIVDQFTAEQPRDNQVNPQQQPDPKPDPQPQPKPDIDDSTPPPLPPSKAKLISDANGFFELKNGFKVKLENIDKIYLKDDKYYKDEDAKIELENSAKLKEMKNDNIVVKFNPGGNKATLSEAKEGLTEATGEAETIRVEMKSYHEDIDLLSNEKITQITIKEPITFNQLQELKDKLYENDTVIASFTPQELNKILENKATEEYKLLKKYSATIANATKDDANIIKQMIQDAEISKIIDPNDPALKLEGVQETTAPMSVADFLAKGYMILSYKDVEISDPKKLNATLPEAKALVKYKSVLKEGQFEKLQLTITEPVITKIFIGLKENLDVIKTITLQDNSHANLRKLEDIKFIVEKSAKIADYGNFKVGAIDLEATASEFKSIGEEMKNLIKDNALVVIADIDEINSLKSETKIAGFLLKGKLTDDNFFDIPNIKDRLQQDAIAEAELNTANTIFGISTFTNKFKDNSVSIVENGYTMDSNAVKILSQHSSKLKDGTIDNIELSTPSEDIARIAGIKAKIANSGIKKITGEISAENAKILKTIEDKLAAQSIKNKINIEATDLTEGLKTKIVSEAEVVIEKVKGAVAATAGEDTLKLDAGVKDATDLNITDFQKAHDKINFSALNIADKKEVAENGVKVTLENGKLYLFKATADDAAGLIANFGDEAGQEFDKALADGDTSIIISKSSDGSKVNIFKIVGDADGQLEEDDITLLGTVSVQDADISLDNIIF